MDREELTIKNELANSPECKQLIAYIMEYIVEQSGTAIEADKIKGMLLVVNHIEGWKTKYLAELRKAQKQNERN